MHRVSYAAITAHLEVHLLLWTEYKSIKANFFYP